MSRQLIILLVVVFVGACGGGGGGVQQPPVQLPPAPSPPPPTPVQQLDAALDAAYANSNTGATGMGFTLTGRNGQRLYEWRRGNWQFDDETPVYSASKIAAGFALLVLVEEGLLTLDSTTGDILGWTGENADITLEQLMSFTSGLPGDADCINFAAITLQDCVQEIAGLQLIAAPGTRYDYGSTHLQVAAAMAEVVTGMGWNDLFDARVRLPLGLPRPLPFYTVLGARVGLTNPRIGGGMVASQDDYHAFLQAILDGGAGLVSTRLIDRMSVEPFPDAAIGFSPYQVFGVNFRYGLATWLECDTPATGCTVIASPGGGGWTPWVDQANGYSAVIGMNRPPAAAFSVLLAQELKPLIIQLLASLLGPAPVPDLLAIDDSGPGLTVNPPPAVDPVDDLIGVVCIGMSNSRQECDAYINRRAQGLYTGEVDPRVRFVNCAVGSHAIERWVDAAFDDTLWNACLDQRLPAAGVRPDQVRVIWHKAARQFDSGPFIDNLTAFAGRIKTFFPEVQAVYTTSRSYGGFAANPLRGEPRSHGEGLALNEWLLQFPVVEGVTHLWGPYIWAPDCTGGRTNGSGVCYVRADYQTDGVHPSPSGLVKIADMLHKRLVYEDWYRP